MILQKSIPYDPTKPRPLPGVAPFSMRDWLVVDDSFTEQMALRRELFVKMREKVFFLDASAQKAAKELLSMILAHLPEGFAVQGDTVRLPDGEAVGIDWDNPLWTAGHLVQEDLCLMQKTGNEHVLTGAVLCFPAGWRLQEKAMQPLLGIHAPVPDYDDQIAKRVQRLFDGLQPNRPLWRFNALWYDDPALYRPRSEVNPRQVADQSKARYLRSERQCLIRLPESRAVVFSIHTYMLDRLSWSVIPQQ